MTKEEEFIESLYIEAEKQIKEVYKEQKKNRDELLQELASRMLTYTILNDLMSLSRVDKQNEYTKLSKLITKASKSQGTTQEKIIEDILSSTVDKTFEFYSYNAKLKDVREIIERNFKGKHFSERVWENEQEVANVIHKQINDFLNGKINVNQIKNEIEKTFNNGAYNTKRLVETEVNRCCSNAFDRFCIETGVKKVRYNATLDSKLCEDCAQYHNEVFDFRTKIEVPRHPLCRCFYDIVDDDYRVKSKVDDEIAVSKDDYSDIIKVENIKDIKANFNDMKEYHNKCSNLQVRQWYIWHDENIPNLIDYSKSIEEQAKQAHSLRNLYRTQARDLMMDSVEREKLDREHPNLSFEEQVSKKIQKYGFTREKAFEDILKTATKSNKEVNKSLGLE